MSRLATRLTVAVVGITAGTVLVAALAMWFSLRAILHADIERDLNERCERLQRFTGSGRWRGPRPPDGRAQHAPDGRSASPRLMQVIALDGRTLGAEPEVDLRPAGMVPADGWRGTVARVRVAAIAVAQPPPGSEGAEGGAIVLLGESLAGADAELRRMAIGLSVLWLIATALAVAAAIALRRAVLRPLASLDAEVSRLRPDDLTARLAIGAAPDEVRALVERLNAMLGGLEQAFRREQATIANIAHELRTPVAGLRSEIEFRLLASADPAEQTVLRGLLANVGRMQAMVGNILMLARIEAGREQLAAEVVDLAPLLEAVVERWEARAAARGQTIVCSTTGSTVLTSSSVHLDVVLDNLLGNAAAHGDAGEIAVVLEGSCITVRNPCRTLPDPARLGTAFYRADEARSDGAHCGLGLALCRRISGLLRARLELMPEGGCFTARLSMTAP